MKEPEVPVTFKKMAAFYQCVRPDPRCAPISKEVRGGGKNREGRLDCHQQVMGAPHRGWLRIHLRDLLSALSCLALPCLMTGLYLFDLCEFWSKVMILFLYFIYDLSSPHPPSLTHRGK